jgi:segregation and condensation protein B
MNDDAIGRNIEAILFHKAEAVSVKELSDLLHVDIGKVEKAIRSLEEMLAGRGVQLLRNSDAVMLGTTPETAVIVEQLIKEEIDKELGKAGLETLSIVLYRGPISRSEIDYIRGVNSSYILRSMIMRGLVERVSDTKKKNFLYRPTFELLSYLGVSCVEELPEYEMVKRELDMLMNPDQERETAVQEEQL